MSASGSILACVVLVLLLVSSLRAVPAPHWDAQTEKENEKSLEGKPVGDSQEEEPSQLTQDVWRQEMGVDKKLRANVFMGSRGRRAGLQSSDLQLYHFLQPLRLAFARFLAQQFADDAGKFKRQPQYGFHGARG